LMFLEPRDQTGVSLAVRDRHAGRCERGARLLAESVQGAITRCLGPLKRRLSHLSDMETRRFAVRYDAPGPWILSGARSADVMQFPDLAAALSFARDDSGAGEADIELWIDGLYIFVHQSRGWPHRLCVPAKTGVHRA